MKVLFISSQFPIETRSSNIYTDLAESLLANGHKVKVIVSEEKKNIKKTTLLKERKMDVLRVKCGNMYEVGFIEKALTFLTVSNQLITALKKYWSKEKFDLILFSAPPVTFNKVVKWAMNKYNCPSYLMMKDIFPQNGVDIGLYTKKHPAYIYFKREANKLYKVSSKIGCMSNRNIEYLNKMENVPLEKLELFPNTVKIREHNKITKEIKNSIRKKYGFNDTDVIAVFGGNFGRPQGLDFLLDVIEEYKTNKTVKFLLVGNGTEKTKIFNYIKEHNLKNAITRNYIPREEYETLLASCDIGLIFLDHRFTIPNFPSKTLSYFECSLPIMAAIDENTDYGQMLDKTESGFYSIHGNIKNFKKYFNRMLNDENLRIKMGKNGRKYFENECNVEKSVKILEKYGSKQ